VVSVMLMTGWFTAEASRKPRLSRSNFKRVWQSARLELHPTKTKVVYCKDRSRRGAYPNVQFDFLGYCFRPRRVRRSRDNTLFCGFNPAVSSLGAESHALDDQGLGHPTSNTAVVGRCRPADQSPPTGLD